jgi:hypothetical protein
MDDGEVERAGATPDSLGHLLNDYYRPAMIRQKRDTIDIQQSEYGVWAVVAFRVPDGKRIGISFAMHRRGGRIVISPLINNIVYTAMLAQLPPGEPLPLQRQRLVHMLKQYSQDADKLARTGLRGFDAEGLDGQVFYTWAEYPREIQASIQRYDARQASARAEPPTLHLHNEWNDETISPAFSDGDRGGGCALH